MVGSNACIDHDIFLKEAEGGVPMEQSHVDGDRDQPLTPDTFAFYERRKALNQLMYRSSPLLKDFNQLDVGAYLGKAIPVKYKELTGLSLAVAARCDECVRYHVKMCVDNGATAEEMVEAVEIAIVTAGSWSFPQARLVFQLMRDFGLNGSTPEVQVE